MFVINGTLGLIDTSWQMYVSIEVHNGILLVVGPCKGPQELTKRLKLCQSWCRMCLRLEKNVVSVCKRHYRKIDGQGEFGNIFNCASLVSTCLAKRFFTHYKPPRWWYNRLLHDKMILESPAVVYFWCLICAMTFFQILLRSFALFVGSVVVMQNYGKLTGIWAASTQMQHMCNLW